MQRRNWMRRNAIRMSVLALMFAPLLMGGNSDCNSSNSSDTVQIVTTIVEAVLAIVFLFV